MVQVRWFCPLKEQFNPIVLIDLSTAAAMKVSPEEKDMSSRTVPCKRLQNQPVRKGNVCQAVLMAGTEQL